MHDDVDGQPLALGVGHPAFEADGGAEPSAEHLGELGLDGQQVVGMDEVAQQVPDERVRRAAEHDGDRGALVDDASVGVRGA